MQGNKSGNTLQKIKAAGRVKHWGQQDNGKLGYGILRVPGKQSTEVVGLHWTLIIGMLIGSNVRRDVYEGVERDSYVSKTHNLTFRITWDAVSSLTTMNEVTALELVTGTPYIATYQHITLLAGCMVVPSRVVLLSRWKTLLGFGRVFNLILVAGNDLWKDK